MSTGVDGEVLISTTVNGSGDQPRARNGMVIVVGDGKERADELLAVLSTRPLTYAEVGASVSSELPTAYRHVRRSVVLGRGSQVWNDATEAFTTWRVHLGAGLSVFPRQPEVREGQDLVSVLRLGPVTLLIPCRIVLVVRARDRVGFAYGTLAGHPEQGEEAFFIHQDEDGVVTFTITAFSRPAQRIARVVRPLGNLM